MLLCVQHTAYSKKDIRSEFSGRIFFVAGNLLSAITPRSAAQPLRFAPRPHCGVAAAIRARVCILFNFSLYN